MILKSLELNNFRNYENLEIHFDEGTNIFYGDNAQGKTNILEAVFLSCTTKSHKGSKDKEMIRFGCEESHIRTFLEKKGTEYRIDMHLKNGHSKNAAINQISVRRSSELYGFINIICFSPEDLNLIKEGPAERRRFLDMEICQLDKIYLSDLSNYHKVLNQRNQLLKDLFVRPELKDTLPVWDIKMIEYGQRIIRARKNFIDQLNEIIRDVHYRISGKKEEITLKYEWNVDDASLEEELTKARSKDMKMGQTTVGPHRDDVLFDVNGIDIRKYGSQGQQRTSALSLKLAEIELVKKSTGENPILLLDDVMSELDSNRQNFLLKSISDIQTLITCTGLDEFIKNQFQINKVFNVCDGKIMEADS